MSMQKTIGVLVAMSVEYHQVAAIMQDTETLKSGPQEFLVGRVGENKVALLQCGIGKANAASGVTNLILTFHPDCIISTGVAGGIDAKLKVMDVVISKEACYHDVVCGDDCDPGQVQGLPLERTIPQFPYHQRHPGSGPTLRPVPQLLGHNGGQKFHRHKRIPQQNINKKGNHFGCLLFCGETGIRSGSAA